MTEIISVKDSRGTASPLGRSLVLLGDAWNVRIIRSVFTGRRRFQVLRDALNISDPVLSRRLQALVGDGILQTHAYQVRPIRNEYFLTEAGKDLWRVLIALWAWDRTWAGRNHPAADIELIHTACGKTTRPVFGCGHCGAIGLTARDVRGSADDNLLLDVTHRRNRRSAAKLGVIDATSILGDHWSIMILSNAFMGFHRFSEFQRQLGVSPVTLNNRLSSFLTSGMMSRESLTEGARRQVYRLTPMGISFFTVTTMINGWAQTWLAGDGNSGLSLVHQACGHEVEPRFTCNNCNLPLERHTVRFEFNRQDTVAEY